MHAEKSGLYHCVAIRERVTAALFAHAARLSTFEYAQIATAADAFGNIKLALLTDRQEMGIVT